MELSDPLKITKRLTDVLDGLGIRYLVGGSLASSLHGIPRATQDADVVAEIRVSHLSILEERLSASFYFDVEMALKAIGVQSSFNIIDKKDLFKIDIFVAKSDELSVEEMNHRVLHSLADEPGQSMYVCGPEDIIAHKLYWYKLGEGVSERQWRDAINVIKVQRERLDIGYLKRMCAGRNVGALLEKALAESVGD